MTLMKPFAIVFSLLLSGPVLAQQCETSIEGNDLVKYGKSGMEIPAGCKDFKVTLKHTGKLPKAAVGHNWVLARTSHMQPVANDAIKAGLQNDYIPKGDARV